MNSRTKEDRLSVLPDNVKDSILTLLTIKEAVRTSILSQSWRCQWHCLSKINISRSDLLEVSRVGHVKIIDHILLSHYGSFDKFKLDIHSDTPTTDIGRWILYLSRHGIKDLIIKANVGQHYNLPNHLFACSELTRLELRWCRLIKSPPVAFKAFSNMTELLFDHVRIDDEVLEKLINSCPLLRRLSLLCVYGSSFRTINAPKLVTLVYTNYDGGFPLAMNTPLLEHASFGSLLVTNHQEHGMISELVHSMPLLRRLELKHAALRNLAVGDIPARLALVCPVKHLILSINFKDLKEMQAAFCIFRSSPFIRILDLTNKVYGATRIPADVFWKGEAGFNLRFDSLQEVKLTSLTGTEYELKFVEFILANAPALETMEIKFGDGSNKVEDWFTIITKLTCFPRASSRAKLILPSKL